MHIVNAFAIRQVSLLFVLVSGVCISSSCTRNTSRPRVEQPARVVIVVAKSDELALVSAVTDHLKPAWGEGKMIVPTFEVRLKRRDLERISKLFNVSMQMLLEAPHSLGVPDSTLSRFDASGNATTIGFWEPVLLREKKAIVVARHHNDKVGKVLTAFELSKRSGGSWAVTGQLPLAAE